MNKTINILVVEPSPLISEGLSAIFSKSGLKFRLSVAGSSEELEHYTAKKEYELIIVNPIFVQSNVKGFNILRNQYKSTKWVGLVYSYADPKTLSWFDAQITVSDSLESIMGSINKLLEDGNQPMQNLSQEVLSERETDVLKLLATGMANKEIADKLNISINTVITHRKNISQKTGIKSVSGLTIYAVVQKLIKIDALSE